METVEKMVEVDLCHLSEERKEAGNVLPLQREEQVRKHINKPAQNNDKSLQSFVIILQRGRSSEGLPLSPRCTGDSVVLWMSPQNEICSWWTAESATAHPEGSPPSFPLLPEQRTPEETDKLKDDEENFKPPWSMWLIKNLSMELGLHSHSTSLVPIFSEFLLKSFFFFCMGNQTNRLLRLQSHFCVNNLWPQSNPHSPKKNRDDIQKAHFTKVIMDRLIWSILKLLSNGSQRYCHKIMKRRKKLRENKSITSSNGLLWSTGVNFCREVYLEM